MFNPFFSPSLLAQLANETEKITKTLSVEEAQRSGAEAVIVSQSVFRHEINEDAMATEKLSEGIRKFAVDARILETLVNKHL